MELRTDLILWLGRRLISEDRLLSGLQLSTLSIQNGSAIPKIVTLVKHPGMTRAFGSRKAYTVKCRKIIKSSGDCINKFGQSSS